METASWEMGAERWICSGHSRAGNRGRSMPSGTSDQKAELITLIRVLQLSSGMKVNIYTDSKYVFMIAHACGAIWKERRLPTAGNKDIKYAVEILVLFQAVTESEGVAIMCCPGHQILELCRLRKPGS